MFSQDMLVGGIALGAFLILLVQSLKFLGVTDEKWLKLAPLFGAILFVGLFTVKQLVPASAPIVDGVMGAFVVIATATLGYAYAVKPVAQKLGISVTTEELE
jgi:hypothetical protein